MMAEARRSPGLWASASRIFGLSLGEMLWSRRSIFLALVVGAPVVLAVAIRLVRISTTSGRLWINGSEVAGPALFGLMIWYLFVNFVVPVLGAFYGTSLIADEVEDKTITYLFTRPIPRGAVLLGKYLAYLACTTLLILPSVVLVYFLIVPLGGGGIGASFPSLLTDLGLLAFGLASYGALFAWVGATLKRPLVIGLVFVLGWEPAVMNFPGYLKRATVSYYLHGLVPHAMPEDAGVSALLQIVREIPSIGASVVGLLVIIGAALWLSVRVVERKEYILEQ